jgi:Flp pilus assembly pilin Flp
MEFAQGTVEYALILALVVIVVIVILSLTGTNIAQVYCRVVGALGGAACSSYCSDDLNSLGGWTTSGSSWSINSGQVCTVGNQPEGRMFNRCSFENPNIPPTNYVINAENATLTAGNGYGIIFRTASTTPLNGYTFQYDPGASGFIIRKWINGAESTLAYRAFPAGFQINAPHNLQVVVNGNTYKAYVDGVLMLTATDATYTSGGSGLRRWDATSACIDNFNISAIPAGLTP